MTYANEINYILQLLKSAVSDNIPPNPTNNLDWEVIFKIAKKHKICSTIYFGLQKLPASTQNMIPHFHDYFLAYQKNLILDANRSFEIDNLKNEFENNNIDYVLLKGSVTKYLYPDTSMRVMSDTDIFYRIHADKTESLISIMEKNGYKISAREPKEVSFIKPLIATSQYMKIEMQTDLIDEGYEIWHTYLSDIWNRLILKKGHEYMMSDEDFYLYHIIHMAKHFKNGGIGLIHVLDVFIIQNAYKNFDRKYIEKELKKTGLLQFEQNITLLADNWFHTKSPKLNNDQKITLQLLESYIFSGGAFGSKIQQETNHIVERDDTKVSLLKKIFPTKNIMINYYGNILNRHSWLLPFFWIRLNFKRLFFTRNEAKLNYKAMNQITDTKITKTKDLMRRCGF